MNNIDIKFKKNKIKIDQNVYEKKHSNWKKQVIFLSRKIFEISRIFPLTITFYNIILYIYMINNLLMIHKNIFIICVLIPIFIYFFFKTGKSYLFLCKLYLILKAQATYQKLFKFGQMLLYLKSILFVLFSTRYLLERFVY